MNANSRKRITKPSVINGTPMNRSPRMLAPKTPGDHPAVTGLLSAVRSGEAGQVLATIGGATYALPESLGLEAHLGHRLEVARIYGKHYVRRRETSQEDLLNQLDHVQAEIHRLSTLEADLKKLLGSV